MRKQRGILHFEKNHVFQNRICQPVIFLLFHFMHFLCKVVISYMVSALLIFINFKNRDFLQNAKFLSVFSPCHFLFQNIIVKQLFTCEIFTCLIKKKMARIVFFHAISQKNIVGTCVSWSLDLKRIYAEEPPKKCY